MSRAASQVCAANSTAASPSAAIIAHPTRFAAPSCSSARRVIASKPRNDSIATLTPASTTGHENAAGSNTGSHDQPFPPSRHTTHPATSRNTARTISSAIRNRRVAVAVTRIPDTLITMFTPTNANTHAQTGISGTVACMLTAATTASRHGTAT